MYGVKLRVWGEYACFTRPEMKAERVSYDVMTPSAARGILEAIHWKPAISWIVDTIHVLKPVRFSSVRRNELGSKLSASVVKSAMRDGSRPVEVFIEEDRKQRAALVLHDVEYVIQAHFEMTNKAGPGDNPGKHLDIFNRHAAKGQCFHRPYLGCREFAAQFELVRDDIPASAITGPPKDLGWMLHDIDYAADMEPRFFRPTMVNGVIDCTRRAA